MGHERFDWHATKDGAVRIFWEGRCVMTIGGARGTQLAVELEEADDAHVQYLLQRATGNFRRGNERQAGRHPRN